MGGLLLFVVAALYIAAGRWLYMKLRSKLAKVVVVAILALIPTGDAVYGRIQLKQLCAADGGTRIHNKVTGVTGFYAPESDLDEWITKYGYSFVEGNGSGGPFTKKMRGAAGKLVKFPVSSLESNYSLKHERAELPGHFHKSRMVVVSLRTYDELATFTNFSFEGGWIERLLAAVYASQGWAGDCGHVLVFDKEVELVTSSLPPTK